MEIILSAIIMVFLLIMLDAFLPKMAPFFLLIFFFLLLAQLTFRMAVPLLQELPLAWDGPGARQIRLIAGSAFLFYLSASFRDMLGEIGYAPIGRLSHMAVQLLLVGVWLGEFRETAGVLTGLLP
ncbi:hypothetical protein AV656_02365 [Bhargavaea cecembensis]|uniref:Uncharacterized protein n=1 Tax=Bhargavaea cecembensis TaxID=394098 RepID=A0A165HIV7_9BACL|nr:hypothetical protein [Bhargavaea cecembensis]KZE40138.1 hypothetical protein AV656_02365 [Bhargavaea cecembensis]